MARRVIVSVLLLALTACSPSIRTEPFTEFSKTARELRDGADAALRQAEESSRERTIQGAVEDLSGEDEDLREEVLLDLVLSFDESEPWSWSDASLPYLATARFRENIYELNNAFSGYCALLATLASATPLSEGAVDTIASDLNRGTRSILGQLSVANADQTSGLIATAAATGFQEYLRSRQSQQLKRAIADNQPTITAFSGHMAEACKLAALDLRQSYLSAMEVLAVNIEKAIGTTRLPARVEDLLDTNDEFKDQIRALRDIEATYRLIPAAHHDLIRALDDDRDGYESIRILLEQAQRLQSRYEGLQP